MSVNTIQVHPKVEAFLKDSPKKLFIGGKFVESASGKKIKSYNPATGEVLCEAYEADEQDVNRAVELAEKAFHGEWSKISSSERSRMLWKLADLIEENLEPMAQLETLDNGKPIRETRNADVPLVIDHFRYYAGWVNKFSGEVINNSLHPHMFTYTRREPIGVCGQIIPWNFPLLMAAWKLGAALATGNVVILKSAEDTPLSVLFLAELIQQAGFPEGVVNIITGRGTVAGSAMNKHPRIRKIAFTGSTEVGKIIMREASENVKIVTLELGGKSPNIVFPDADFSKAIPGALHSIFFNQGQVCSAGSRLFVHKKIYDNFLSDMASEANKLKVGPGLEEETQVGPLVSAKQYETVRGYLEKGKAEGAKALTGGTPKEGPGYFVPPTIFADVEDKMTIAREEIFGPVVSALPFNDDEHLTDLIKRANSSEYGLAAGVWTTDVRKAHKVAHALEAGTVWVNCYNVFDAAMPFGGFKQSGIGREMGKYALEMYTEVKSVWVNLE